MKDFSDILICSDFDQTLFNTTISDTDAEAIRYFQERGGAFTLCTGRPPFVLQQKEITNISLNAPIISMNGALIYDLDRQKRLMEDTMDSDIADVICKLCDKIEYIDKLFIPVKVDIHKSEFIAPSDREKIRTLAEQGVYKVVFHINKEKDGNAALELAKNAVPEKFTVSRSWAWGIEIQNATSSKGISARRVADMLGKKTLICAGDYENDISMIEEADIGYAVENACEALKSVADRVTVSPVGGAIAEMIHSL